MKILLVEPEKRPEITEISGTLESMQNVVGGLIQMICPFYHDPEIALICNDEGKLIGLPPSRILIDDRYNVLDVISGTFFLCFAPPDSDTFESLPDDKLVEYKGIFSLPVVQI